MQHIRRNERLAAITRILTASPNRVITLSHFADLFGAAKSTLSEDIDILSETLARFGLGQLDTVTGAAGGVRYRPALSKADALAFVQSVADRLAEPGRVLPGGFLYMADALSNPEWVEKMGAVMAGEFYGEEPDFVLTMETKGIPVALMAAKALGVPLVIARRSSKVYEGPAVNINYLSGSAGRIETMSLSRRAVREGQRALIVDDFMKAGGTIRGMLDMMREFSVTVVGVCVVIATAEPERKRLEGAKALMIMEAADDERDSALIRPGDWLMEQ